MKQINGNVEWKIITKLNVNSTAFFEPEESELRTETEEQLSPLGKTDVVNEGRESLHIFAKMDGFCSLEILFRTKPKPRFCCHIHLKNFLPGEQSCYP